MRTTFQATFLLPFLFISYFWGWPWTDLVVQMALNSKWSSCLVPTSARITSVFPSLQLWKSLLLKTKPKYNKKQNQTTTPGKKSRSEIRFSAASCLQPCISLGFPVACFLLGHLVYKPSVLSFPPRPFPESSLFFLCSLIFWISLASCSSDAANQTLV